MTRLTITIPNPLYARLSVMATQNKESISSLINEFIIAGMQKADKTNEEKSLVEEHCQQLTIQMNVLIKKLSEKILDLTKEDFHELRKTSIHKHSQLKNY
jgi:hypothetical protein